MGGQQIELAEGDTLVADTTGYFLTGSQYLQFTNAVDSLDFWRGVAEAERGQKRKWQDLYFRLDSLYAERDAVSASDGFGVRDAGFWGLMGAAAAIVVNEVLEDG